MKAPMLLESFLSRFRLHPAIMAQVRCSRRERSIMMLFTLLPVTVLAQRLDNNRDAVAQYFQGVEFHEEIRRDAVAQYFQGAMNNPEVQMQMQDAMQDPEVQKQVAEAMKDPEVQKKMQEIARLKAQLEGAGGGGGGGRRRRGRGSGGAEVREKVVGVVQEKNRKAQYFQADEGELCSNNYVGHAKGDVSCGASDIHRCECKSDYCSSFGNDCLTNKINPNEPKSCRSGTSRCITKEALGFEHYICCDKRVDLAKLNGTVIATYNGGADFEATAGDECKRGSGKVMDGKDGEFICDTDMCKNGQCWSYMQDTYGKEKCQGENEPEPTCIHGEGQTYAGDGITVEGPEIVSFICCRTRPFGGKDVQGRILVLTGAAGLVCLCGVAAKKMKDRKAAWPSAEEKVGLVAADDVFHTLPSRASDAVFDLQDLHTRNT